MSESGHLRTNGTAILRVRSLGYTGRELDVAGTSLLSQKQTLIHGQNDLSVANSYSRGDREFEKATAMQDRSSEE